jgi:hypothetical protein
MAKPSGMLMAQRKLAANGVSNNNGGNGGNGMAWRNNNE